MGAAPRDRAPIVDKATSALGPPSLDPRPGDPLGHALLEALPGVVVLLDRECTVSEVHRSEQAGLGSALEALRGERLDLRLAEASRSRLCQEADQVLRTGQVRSLEVDWAFDGRPHRLDLRLARVAEDGLLGLVRDVTETADTASLLERISRAVPGLVYLYSRWPDGRDAFLYLNAAAERILGVPAERIWSDAKAAWSRVLPEDQPALARAIEDSFASGEPLEHPFRVSRDGQVCWLRAQARPSRPGPDSAVTWAGVVLDITREKLAEEERLRLAERAARTERLEQLGLMAGGIAHDFNNLLVGVFASAAQLAEELGPDHPARPMAQEIELAAARMADITRQMLHFSGRNPAPPRRVNLSRAVRESLALVQASVGGGARVELRLASDGPSVVMDPGQVTQLLANLVLNSADAIGQGAGTIWVETGWTDAGADLVDALSGAPLPPGRYGTLEVRDDGPGMAADVQSRMFEPYFSTKEAGRGLGLSVVAGIARTCGGTVWVESAPGRGTRIRVLLPLAGAVAEERPQPPPGPTSGAALVLVVDDEPHVRSVSRRILERAGYKVLLAEDGQMALELARDAPVRLALVDATMPGMSGAQVLRALASLRPGLPLVLMSGYAREEVRDAAAAAAAGFVAKPFTPDQLRAAVRSALDVQGRDAAISG
jgi:PAS domain S-box-containing protein